MAYGKLCKNSKVKDNVEDGFACSSLVSSCSADMAKQWLSEEIDKNISCIKSTSNINSAYNKASTKSKVIIISMAYQLCCSGLADFKKTLTYMANGQWKKSCLLQK